jgi:hypothetical protein
MEVVMTRKKNEKSRDKAVAYKDGRKPGPDESSVQIRPAGAESTADGNNWDDRDEASDESFPASDSSAKY